MPQASAQVVESQRMLRLNRQCAVKRIGRFFELALSDQNVAQVIERLKVIGPQAESLLIALSRAVQVAPGLLHNGQKDPAVGKLGIGRYRLPIEFLSRFQSASLEVAPG